MAIRQKKKRRNINKQPRQPLAERLGDSLELPRSAVGGGAHIELAGNREAFVDGCKGILAYDDCCIRLNTGKLIVCFSGSELSISALQMEQAVVSGNIAQVSFSN